MADLSSLMQIAPFAGSYATLQSNDLENLLRKAQTGRENALTQGSMIANQQSQDMNPLLLQQQQLHNKGLEAGVPGIQADSDLKSTNAKKAAGTLDSDIAAGIDDNKTKESLNKVKRANATGQLLTDTGQYLKTIGVQGGIQSQLAATQYLQSLGIQDDHPVRKMVMGMSANPDSMIQYGDNLIKHSEAYMQAMDVENKKSASSEKIAAGHDATQRGIEQMRIDAGKYNKGQSVSFENVYGKLKSSRDKHAALIDEATKARLGGDNSKAAEYLARAEAIRPQAEAEISAINPKPGTVDLSKLGGDNSIPTNPKPTIAPPVTGEGGPAPAGQAQAIPPGAIQMLKQNPSLRAAFDAKYGQGASIKVLGQ